MFHSFQSWLKSRSSQKAAARVSRLRCPRRLRLDRLEERMLFSATPASLGEIVDRLHEGMSQAVQHANYAKVALDNFDLPLIREAGGDILKIKDKLSAAFNSQLNTATTLGELKTALENAGFVVEYLSDLPDANGDLVRVTREMHSAEQINVNVGGATRFAYFDSNVRGGLTGNFALQAPDIITRVTFGVDVSGGVPSFFVSDASFVKADDLRGSGAVNAELGIGFLLHVNTSGMAAVDLDAAVTLRDSDGDHKLRLGDLASGQAYQADLDGQVTLDASMTSNLPMIQDITWTGRFDGTILNGAANTSFSLQAPNARNVLDGLTKGLFGASGGFNPLGSLGTELGKPLPVIDKSVAELLGVDGTLGWLKTGASLATDVLSFDQINQALQPFGVKVNFSAADLSRLINGERVDLLSFQQEGGNRWQCSASTLPIKIPVGIGTIDLSGVVSADVGWDYFIGLGMDTTGFYIDPRTQIGISGGVRAGANGGFNLLGFLNIADVQMGAGLTLSCSIRLEDPDPTDGRIYLDEIYNPADDVSLGQSFLDAMHVELRGDAIGYIKAEINLPWPLPDISLLDEQLQMGTIFDMRTPVALQNSKRVWQLVGQDTKPMPAVLQTDGTLLIKGHATNPDYVALTGGNGTVNVTWAGYRPAQFTGVQRVRFYGYGGADQLETGSGFNIPIEAYGGAGNDVLVGGDGKNTLRGDDGNDVLYGGAGADSLNGGLGDDRLVGGAGNDVVTGGPGILAAGQTDNDQLDGGDGDDVITGGAGDDVADGGAGADKIYGNAGFDTLRGGADGDTIDGGTEDDRIFGDDGNDLSLAGGAGRDVISGGAGNDTLVGGTEDDYLFGNAGIDVLRGDAGNDVLVGGADNDTLRGGIDNDTLDGEAGNDTMYGDDGDDVMFGGDGDDILNGGNQSDRLNGQAGLDTVRGDAGNDWLTVDFATSSGTIVDKLFGGVDMDTIFVAGRETMVVRAGKMELVSADDTIELTQLSPVRFRAIERNSADASVTGTMEFTVGSTTSGLDIEQVGLYGGGGNDRLTVAPSVTRNTVIDGSVGDDVLTGGAGRDLILGGTGNDTLVGGANNDELHGGDDQDSIDGGLGDDRLFGEGDDDTLNGGDGRDIQYGGAGNDTLAAGPGILGDLMYGGADNDTLFGGAGIDVMSGDSGSDVLRGGAMGDVLLGGSEMDFLYGEAGRDLLLGGAGDDFLFANDEFTVEDAALSNWIAIYGSLLAREIDVFAQVQAAEARLTASNLDPQEKAILESQSSEGQNELAALNEAETDVLPKQEIRIDILDGGDDNDELTGSQYDDLLNGNDGNDVIHHSAGHDVVSGGSDSDGKDLDEYRVKLTDANEIVEIRAEEDRSAPDSGNLVPTYYVNGVFIGQIVMERDLEVFGLDAQGGDDVVIVDFGPLDEVLLDDQGNPMQPALTQVKILAGSGNDSIDASLLEAKTYLFGEDDNDTITGGRSDDLIDGGEGNDVLSGGMGQDTIHGGDGDDVMNGSDGDDVMHGGIGEDTIHGDGGNDQLYGDGDNDEIHGGDGDDVMDGSDGDDVMHGGFGEDTMLGGSGNDHLYGDNDNDRLFGGSGYDFIDAGQGADWAEGDEGGDIIYGGDGDDGLVGDEDGDELHGGEGNDRLWGGLGADGIYGDAGNDQINGQEDGDYCLFGGDGDDQIWGMGGNDFIMGGAGQDWIDAGDGNNQVYGGDYFGSVGDGADTIGCGNGNDYVSGGRGNDYIYGGAGDDLLLGEAGDDVIRGHLGADQIWGGEGLDDIDGGPAGENDYLEQ